MGISNLEAVQLNKIEVSEGKTWQMKNKVYVVTSIDKSSQVVLAVKFQ
jgi:hypothetical protein